MDSLRDVKIEKVRCGENFTIALVESSNVYSWGDNTHGQLGYMGHEEYMDESVEIIKLPIKVGFFSENNINVIGLSGGKDHALFWTDKGHVYGSGSNSRG